MAPRRASARGGRRGAATPTPGGHRASPEGSDAAASSIVTEPVSASSGGAEDASVGGGRATAPRGARNPASRASAAGRFRPRAVRRDEADRDALARQEQQKALDRAADERRARGRTRYRSKRSRGEAMGSRGGFGRGITTASGPFSGGSASTSKAAGWGGSSSSGLGGGFKSGSGKFVKDESYTYDGRDRSQPREARINADKLHARTPEQEPDSGDEAMMEALHHRGSSVLPIGIYRREHKKPAVVVATTAELEAVEHTEGTEESLWVDGDGGLPPGDQPTEHGVWDAKAIEEVRIKKEPETEDSMMVSEVKSKAPEGKRLPPSMTQVKKGAQHDTEAQRIREDMSLLASELGAVTVAADSESAAEGPTNKDGRLYLFQLPPLLPPLRQQHMPQQVKHEAGASDRSGVPLRTSSKTAVDLTAGGAGGDGDDGDDEDDDDDDDDDDEPGGFRSQLLAQGGMIGRLNVHQSGRVELDWGGTALALSPAAGMDFLTTAAIVEEKEGKADSGSLGGGGGGGGGGDCIGMGKIMGRFVLAPVWNDEEEWNVAPDELVVG